MQQFIIAGIGTEIGKTMVASIFTEALEADYWKPIQSGGLDYTDSDQVRYLLSNSRSKTLPEAYRLQLPASPHAAAEAENITIDPTQLVPPSTDNPNLVVELAGGLMVPITRHFLNIDLVKQLQKEVILVSRYYLGSINHTLLSFKILRQYHIPIKGIVFNGSKVESSKSVILEYTNLPCLLEIDEHDKFTPSLVKHYATALNQNLDNLHKGTL
ncbi:MAG: dethiobiotin synthase [Cytophagales bacterium]|nr:MAG: dethiobiotin synthase [Cytophagales bacterium]